MMTVVDKILRSDRHIENHRRSSFQRMVENDAVCLAVTICMGPEL